ncbi:hypothetical protein [Ahrensia marina]|uniref:Uncharacterized protein n=1 Tax=Ahrensia marina TaxID=1514904 RepID=A0A0N0E7N2_9HYPH|nr:hypothetical protein [Ahrensia marina]KPB01391.1 hypothetical protein SU32_09100 [Ahrensia marina]
MSDATVESKKVAIASYIAAGVVRGIDDILDHEVLIRDKMSEENIAGEHYISIRLMMDTLITFANAVRAAERKDRPLVAYLDENLPKSLYSK